MQVQAPVQEVEKKLLHFDRTFIYTSEPGQCKHKWKNKVKKHRFHWFHVTMALWKRLGLRLCIFPTLHMNWMCECFPCIKHVNQALGGQRFYQAYRDANLWRSNLWRLSFFSLSPPPPYKLTQPPMGMTRDMKSCMKYMLSKFAIIVLMLEIIFGSD